MKPTTRVDFHCHSSHSDGALSPAQVAERLSTAGVQFAALTDHDTTEGLADFAEAAARLGLGVLSGLELTTDYHGDEAHLLAYGFDPAHPELQETLRALRQTKPTAVHSIADSMRQLGGNGSAGPLDKSCTVQPDGRLNLFEAIDLIHRAGGQAFLAHPFTLRPETDALEPLLADLQAHGLDGLEALYAPAGPQKQQLLYALARRLGLLVSAGSDLHDTTSGAAPAAGVEMPVEAWREFRTAVCSGGHCGSILNLAARRGAPLLRRRHIAFHIVFPSLLAVGLFALAIFAVLLPSFEHSLLDRKREMIRELTNSAWSILAEYHREEQAGLLSRAQAQKMAQDRIEYLRYGRDRKDYFWLQDMHPRIIMHPYRKDLNGQDVSGFQDPRGVRIFVEFANLVRRQDESYIQYVWQWKDDPSRLVPKESYIKGFKPWGWVIGTGLYIEDVEQEIARLERDLVRLSLGICLVVALLLGYVTHQSLHLERQRRHAEEGLRASRERYRLLVEAASEGTLLVLEGRCRYANPQLLEMLGYTQQELELLDLTDLLPREDTNEVAWQNVTRLGRGEEPSGGFEGALRRRDGRLVACVLTFSRIAVGGQAGFILLARDISPRSTGSGAAGAASYERLQSLGRLAEASPLGLFRCPVSGRGLLLQANAAALTLLRSPAADHDDAPPALADLFTDTSAYEDFLTELGRAGAAERLVHVTSPDGHTRALALAARLSPSTPNQPRLLDGQIEDVTDRERTEAERAAQLERLQTSLLFLHEPLSRYGRTPLIVDLNMPLRQVAGLMGGESTNAALVRSENGSILGIVTDRDLRVRVIGRGLDPGEPVYRIMSSPLVTIPEHARVYEALLRMEEKAVQHLAVTDETGNIVSLLHNKELLQFHSYGAIVLTREIASATSADQIVQLCRRTPELVRSLLDSGALPRNITRMITAICDAATERFINLAMAQLGPPPAPFVFIALGSQGRQEQTLLSDQDNAIIYADPPDGAPPVPADYFVALGEQVAIWLDQAGYPFCRGEVMARNPRWSQPLAVWKRNFRQWIHKSEPQELLELSIFFDFRPVFGQADLAHELRRHVNDLTRDAAAFFPHFAQNSLSFKPPVRLFGKLLASASTADAAGQLNLKDAMMPLVSFARLYALRHRVDETHTLSRLEALAEREHLPASTVEEIAAAYDFLLRLRLRQHSTALQAGQTPTNLINPRRLGALEETLLKQSFAQITAVQKRLSYDFLGGT